MKKLLISMSSLLLLVTSFAQQTSRDYLRKGRNEKIAAGILIGAGTPLFISGLFIGISDFRAELSTTLIVLGLASMLSSAPIFRASARNKRIAMSGTVGLKIEKTPSIQQFGIAIHSYPAITLRINSR